MEQLSFNPATTDGLSRDKFRFYPDITIDANDLARCIPMDKYKHGQYASNTTFLGRIDALPVELIDIILLYLDLQSLTTFRAVNRRANNVVGSVRQYKIVVNYAPATLRFALATGSATWITVQNLHDTLRTDQCSICGDFGGYIYMFTCRRVCFRCLHDRPEFVPLSQADAKEQFGLDSPSLRTVPWMKSFPGSYFQSKQPQKKRLVLTNRESCRAAGIKLYRSQATMNIFVLEKRTKAAASYNRKIEGLAWEKARTIRKPNIPPFNISRENRTSYPLRFMVAIRAPFIMDSRGTVEWGVSCEGCKGFPTDEHSQVPDDWRRTFTKRTFRDHFQICHHAQNLSLSLQKKAESSAG